MSGQNKLHRFVYSDAELIEASADHLSARSLYGKGIFTTIAIYNRDPFLWDKHWRRLTSNTLTLGIDISQFSEAFTKRALNELLAANDVMSGRARVTFSDETPSEIWSSNAAPGSSLTIVTGNVKALTNHLRLGVSSFTTNSASPLAGVKSCNYLEKLLARDEARARGFDECVQLNERGEVTSASMANIFWLRRGTLFTPPLSTGCLAGTMREFVMENFECEEVSTGMDELRSADEIFLTSAGIGVVQVVEFDRQILNGERHQILDLLPVQNPTA